MRIIRSYILKECIFPFILALLVLTSVFLLGNLIQLANMVINKGVSLATIGKVFLLYVPVLLGYTLPIACLVGVIIAFSRFSADNEILALRTSGIHLSRLLLPISIVGLIISLGSFILNNRVIPYAFYEQQKTLKNLGISNPTAMLEAGIFIHSFQNQILFIHKIDGNKLYNVTIYQPQLNAPTRTIIAKEGEFTPVPGKDQIKLKLMEGTSDEPNLENPDSFYKLNFKNYFITLDFMKEKQEIKKKPKGMTLEELHHEIKKLKIIALDLEQLKEDPSKFEKYTLDLAEFKTEYFRKITWSFSPFFFMMLGFPMAVITHRREKSANIVLAIICAAGYYLLAVGCEALSVQNIIPPGLIMWVPNVAAGVIAIFLNIKCAS